MAAESCAYDRAGCERFEEGGVVAARQRRKIPRGIDQLMAETRRRFTRRLAPKALTPVLGSSRRQPLGRLDMRSDETVKRHGLSREQLGECAEAGFQPIDKPARRVLRTDKGGFETG